MDEKALIKKLETCERPEFYSDAHRQRVKLALLSASRSSRIGIALVALPCAFLFAVFLKYQLRLRMAAFSGFEEYLSRIDHTFFWFVPPLILVGGPLVALAANLLAITHYELDRVRRELVVTLKLKLLNVCVCIACLVVLAVVCAYVVGENRPLQ